MALRTSSVVNHSHIAVPPGKPAMGRFPGQVDPYGPYAIVSTTKKKRDTYLTPSDVGSLPPGEQSGLNTSVTPKARKEVHSTAKPRPVAHDEIGVLPSRTVNAHPASTKRGKKRLGRTNLANAQENI